MTVVAMILGVIVVFAYMLGLAFAVVSYILEAMGLYAIAARMGLNNPWLAWVPVGNAWILGSIADRDEKSRSGKNARLRYWLMGGMILLGVVLLLVMVLYILVFAINLDTSDYYFDSILTADDGITVILLAAVLMIYLLLMSVAIAYSVVCYICLYRLYRACRPDRAVLYTVFSVLFSVTVPFFIFSCRQEKQPTITYTP